MQVIRRLAAGLRGARHIEWALMAVALSALMLIFAGRAQMDQQSDATALERRMEAVLSCIEGAGRVRVLVHPADAAAFAYADAGEGGVLVVAEGAGDLRVSMDIQRAVQALLGIEAGQIEILIMKEAEP